MTKQTSIPESVRNLDLITLAKFNNYFAYPTQGTLRQFMFYNKYDFNKCVRRLGKRIYIKVSDFLDWIENQNKQEVV